jgi:hypothetical protein
MDGILDKNIHVMPHCVSMAKHDSLDRAPLNDEVICREQKLYIGNRLTSYKSVHFIMSLSTEVAK